MEANSVVIIDENNQIIVRTVEDGRSSDKAFDHRPYAASWADGQRVRLKLNQDGKEQI